MRRSTVVQLTLLPMLATAAVAAAQPGPDEPVQQDPDAATSASAPADPAQPSEDAPGDIVLEPPGMTPSIMELDCQDDPNWRLRADCVDVDDVVIVRGGFGGYFWSSHG